MDNLDNPQAQDPSQHILVPLKLDAFVFNAKVCDGIRPVVSEDAAANGVNPTAAKIAPIEQPNYTFLRLNSTLIQPDIQNSVDLYNSWPSEYNSRFTDLGTEKPHPKRSGVYLHWTLPRLFRSGVAAAGKEAAKSESFAHQRASRGLHPSPSRVEEGGGAPPAKPVDHSAPVFPSVPNRWLIIRHIPDRQTILPANAKVPEFAGWVIESDRLWALKDLAADVDLQTDVSPFIAAGGSTGKTKPPPGKKDDTVSKQAEVFIGAKTSLQDWTEQYIPAPPDPPSQPGSGLGDEKVGAMAPKAKPQASHLPHFSLLTSSNQLFADYQPHNTNVFSMCDTFEYGNGKFLEQAGAHYYVVGWYADPKNDMFSGTLLGEVSSQTRKQKFNALKLKIKLENADGKQVKDQDVSKIFHDWLENNGATRTVCHGTIYEVKWSLNKPDNVPADAFATQLDSTLPLAVGTTPLDAMTTYARAHTCLPPPSDNMNDKDKVTVPQLEKWITELERHLLARDDGVETQNQASDLLYNWNYARSDGGQSWNAAGMDAKSDRRGGTPTGLIATLRDLNKEQNYLDATQRAMRRLQRDMFSLWWQCVTDSSPTGANNGAYSEKADKLEEQYNALLAKKDACATTIDEMVDRKTMQPGARPAFYQQQDPTLLIGGVSSGWQHDYLDDLLIRLDGQVLGPAATAERHVGQLCNWQAESPWDDFDSSFGDKFPPSLRKTIQKLVAEFRFLSPKSTAVHERPEEPVQESQPHVATNTTTPPLFHDQYSVFKQRQTEPDTPTPKTRLEPTAPTWRDRWNNQQPWFPLFLEWEVEYHHIPFEIWDLSKRTSRSSTLPQMRYGIPGSKNLSNPLDENPQPLPDRHIIEGRVLLLPQPSFSLGAKIEQLFAGTPKPILDRNEHGHYDYLSPKDRESLQRELHQLAFLSAPLSGLSAHLTTYLEGNHIKPNLHNAVTGAVDPIQEALRPKAGLDEKRMRIIGIETDSTPFAKGKKRPDVKAKSLFKPATHGQFRFRRLNIIDKFGQSIHAITPTAKELGEPVWPCISEWYAPQLKTGTSKPNVIEERKAVTSSIIDLSPRAEAAMEEPPKCPKPAPEPCEFVQIPPTINQFARLNASFVVRVGSENESAEGAQFHSSSPNTHYSASSPYSWRPADEWENPIWGWVLINYANQGIQLFTQDGTFYREVRFGGPNGTQSSPEWLPFRPPSAKVLAATPNPNGPETMQLQKLAARLGDDVFMRSFWDMIKQATDNMQAAPESYAGFTNAALVGRPLALAHAGWSLELSADQLVSQATEDNKVDRKLIGEVRKDHKMEDEDSDAESQNPGQYAFKVAIGDTERGFDGLVGVFNCDKMLDPETRTDLGLILDTVYSGYLPKDGSRPRDSRGKQVIAPARPLVLRPFYPSPATASSADEYAAARNSRLSVRAVLVDPFSPIHAYSGLFPVRELILTPWTWQGALSKMRAFFHSGPVVLSKDVSSTFDVTRELTADKPIVKLPEVKQGEGAVAVPGLTKADWVWLQPYYDPKKPNKTQGPVSDGGADGDDKGRYREALERYMVLPTGPIDDQARFEEGPYTMVEGYLLRIGEDLKAEK